MGIFVKMGEGTTKHQLTLGPEKKNMENVEVLKPQCMGYN